MGYVVCNFHFLTTSLMTMHWQVPFKAYLSQQFSISFDLYLDILAATELRALIFIERNAPDWRLRNACPACTYKLTGEAKLMFEALYTMDGNNSLARLLRRGESTETEEGETVAGPSIERTDTRSVPGGYLLTRDRVDKWTKELLESMIPELEVSLQFYLATL